MTWCRAAFALAMMASVACGDRRARDAALPPPPLALEDLIAANNARAAHLATLQPDLGRGCDAEQLGAVVEIAAGTYPWDDALARHPDDPRVRTYVADLRDRAAMRMAADLSLCLTQSPRPVALALRSALDRALSSPPRKTALEAMLATNGAARTQVLSWLTIAPARALTPRLASLAEVDRVHAGPAYLMAVEIAEAFPVTDAWRAWIHDRQVDDRPQVIDALLAVASGAPVDGAPQPVELAARQAAVQAAVVGLALSAGPAPATSGPAILALTHDPDPIIRRYATQLLSTSHAAQRERLDALVHDPDRLVQLAAGWARGA